MEVLRKLILIGAIVFVFMNCFNICFAEEQVQVLDSLDEYADIVGDNGYDDSYDEPTSEDLKAYYDDYRDYLTGYYESFVREEPISAVILEISDVKEDYQVNYDYSVAKYTYQTAKVKILEGDHLGEEISVEYLLSADALDNIKLAELHVGDKIFINLVDNGDGTFTGEITNSWSTVQRINVVICIGIIAMLLAIIYAGRKGINISLIALIIILSATIIIPVFTNAGMGAVGTSLLISLLLIIAISMAHLGLNANTLKSICISIILSLFSVLLAFGMNYITRTVGTTFEYAAMAENVILGNINFESLFYMSILVISAGVLANFISTCINKINRESSDTFNEKTRDCRDILLSHITIVTLVIFITYIPNHILLLTNKFAEQEIMNSETLVSELIRWFAVIIPIIFAVPIISLEFLKIGKKYLNEAQEDDEEEEKAVEEVKEEVKEEAKEVEEEVKEENKK